MNHKELVDVVAQANEKVPKGVVDEIIRDIVGHLRVALRSGEEVSLVGLGKLKRVHRKARTSHYPNGEVQTNPAYDTVKFVIHKPFKSELN